MEGRYLFILGIFLIAANATASQTILCEPPQGTRVDYFSVNRANLQNQTFHMSKDRISSVRPMIVLGENKEISFALGDSAQMKADTKSGVLSVLIYEAKQISFAGLLNHSPILATYYPGTHTLVYSQQSIWPGPEYEGVRAILFFSKCKVES